MSDELIGLIVGVLVALGKLAHYYNRRRRKR